MFQNARSAHRRGPDRATEQRQAKLALEATLKTDITDIFTQIVPELRSLPRDAAYDRIVGTPQLLASCFQIFRMNPQLFSGLLVDRKRREVRDPDVPLSCGTTLNQTIAFVVRACAWRYFRRKLDPPRRRQTRPEPEQSLWARLTRFWRPEKPMRRSLTASDRLYRAMREYLIYEWQVGLIPHYAPLPLGVVLKLGPRILEYRDPAQLAALARGELPDPIATDAQKKPSAKPQDGLFALSGDASAPSTILGRDLSTLEANACLALWSHMGARALFPAMDEIETRVMIDAVAQANADLLAGLFYMVGLDARQVLLFLVAAEVRLGAQRFIEALGPGGQQTMMNRLGSALSLAGAASVSDPPAYLSKCEQALESVFGPKL